MGKNDSDKNLKGVQLIADKDFESQFVKDYMINELPRYILIDPYGKIINSNTNAPSETETFELLDKPNL